jgi:hypothetical protein
MKIITNNPDWDSWIEDSKKYKPCASLWIDKESDRVELHLDSSASTYNEWIKGEGADISLIRCGKTNKVIGVNLPLYQTDFSIFHTDGIRIKINEGFLKKERIMKLTKEDIIVYSLLILGFLFFVVIVPIGLSSMICEYLEKN